MKRILVPIDFSTLCGRALAAAVELSKIIQAKVVVVHMIESTDGDEIKMHEASREETHFLRNSAMNRLEDFISPYPNEDMETVIKDFKVFSEINELVSELEIDLIIMGSNGSSGAKELFFGSNTEKVVRNSSVPVLVVKDEEFSLENNQAIFCTDLSDESARALNEACTFCDQFGFELEVLHVTSSLEPLDIETEANLMAFRSKMESARIIELIEGSHVERAILSYADQNQTNLVIVPTHGRKGLAHFFRGSIGEDIANHSAKAVLTIKMR